uniref:RING-type E3 ubiquitin transferase n=1 Tax=Manihot esculenta TaxID=3983 RepID=A0A2C9VDI5_MANES
MGHRHLFSTSQMFDGEQDQNWNNMHIEQPYANLARVGPAENGAFFYHAESMPLDGVHFASQRNPAPMSNAFISSSHSVEVSHYQPDAAGPSHDPFLHSSTVGTFCAVPENHAHASSSNYDRQTINGIEGDLFDLTMGNGRGPHKRKSPGVPSSCEGGSTSRYYGAGSSSDPSVPSELRLEKPNLDPQYMAWECITMAPSHRGNLSIGPESSIRNVRSRPALDLETNLSRTHLSSNSSHNSYHAGHPFDHSSSVDFSSQSSSAMTHNWSHTRTSTASGRMLVSDANGYTHETNHFLGFMVVDRSAFYGSRNLFDQHRDMRLDIDNMSYEELLALGERIGSVSTGLDEDLISKCLTETVYRSSGQSEDEGTCVICLKNQHNLCRSSQLIVQITI